MTNISAPQEIKQMRVLSGLTQEKFAEKVGVTSNTVSRWERGLQSPHYAIYKAMRQMFLSTISVDKVVDESPGA